MNVNRARRRKKWCNARREPVSWAGLSDIIIISWEIIQLWSGYSSEKKTFERYSERNVDCDSMQHAFQQTAAILIAATDKVLHFHWIIRNWLRVRTPSFVENEKKERAESNSSSSSNQMRLALAMRCVCVLFLSSIKVCCVLVYACCATPSFT